VDDVAIGRLLRSIRVRLRLRQVDVADRAGLSQQLVSMLELGALEHVSVPALRRVARAVGAEIVIGVRWRGADVDRLRDEDHARMVASVVQVLEGAGWLTATEVTYSVWGERGSIDSPAFHAATRTLLVIEVKTEIVSVEETIRKLDQKTRLAPKIAAERFGWSVLATARLLAVMDTRTSRRHVERHGPVFLRAFPIRGWAARAWLRAPAGASSLLLFLSFTSRSSGRRGPASVRRVPRPRSRSASADSERS
jgi:transcriptional regulator with XRE-family HTH domain